MSDNKQATSQDLSTVADRERTVLDILWHQDEPCYGQADDLLKEALVLAGSHWYKAVLLQRAAKLCRLQGKYDEAHQLLLEGLQVAEEKLGLLNARTGRLREKLRRLLDRKWRNPPFYSANEARERIEQYYKPLIARVSEAQPAVAAALKSELAGYLRESKDWHEDARRLYHEVLGTLEDAGGEIGTTWAAAAAMDLGHIYYHRDDCRRAHEFYSIALRWYGPKADVSNWLAKRVDECAQELEGEPM